MTRETGVAEREAVPSSPEDDYRTHVALLTYLARRRFDVPDAEVPAIVQDVFVAYLRNRARITDVRSWLVGAVCNASRMYWRQRSRETRALERFEQVAAEPDRDLAVHLDLMRVLARLSPRCKELLRLRFGEEYSSAAIAATLSTTVAYARKLVYQCMAAARRMAEIR